MSDAAPSSEFKPAGLITCPLPVAINAIIVSPNLEIPSGVDSECVDGGSAGPAVETWMSQDVPDWVLTTFRARSDRRSWATIGL